MRILIKTENFCLNTPILLVKSQTENLVFTINDNKNPRLYIVLQAKYNVGSQSSTIKNLQQFFLNFDPFWNPTEGNVNIKDKAYYLEYQKENFDVIVPLGPEVSLVSGRILIADNMDWGKVFSITDPAPACAIRDASSDPTGSPQFPYRDNPITTIVEKLEFTLNDEGIIFL